jgi:hypothetical protein
MQVATRKALARNEDKQKNGTERSYFPMSRTSGGKRRKFRREVE